MARIRSIKPEFWTDEKIVDLSPVAKLLYIGIWNFADDDGYITDSARQLQLRIFPGSDYDVRSARDELVNAGLVVSMSSDQGQILNVPKFRDHQTPNRPTATKFTGITASPSPTTHAPLTEDSVSTHGALPLERRGEEGRGKITTLSNAEASDDESESRTTRSAYTAEFEKWWTHYPRRESKGDAFKAWKTLKREKTLPTVDVLISAAEAYAKREPRPEFRKLPGGWLRARKWEDEAPQHADAEATVNGRRNQYGIMPSSADFGRWVD